MLLSPTNRFNHNLGTTVCQYISNACRLTPDADAVKYLNRSYTYAEFDWHVGRIAAFLAQSNVGKGCVVAVAMERSEYLVFALHGIIRAGASYLPLDLTLPADRATSMLAKAAVQWIFSDSLTIGQTRSFYGYQTCDVESLFANKSGTSVPSIASLPGPSDSAYVIFTSGTSGTPKGCEIGHAALLNRLLWMQQSYPLKQGDRILQKTPYSFDVSVWEFFWPLMFGATLVVLPPGSHKSPATIVRTIVEESVTVCHFVPSMLTFFLNEKTVRDCASLRIVFASGEALSYSLMERFFQLLTCRLVNLYGPTEAAIDVTAWDCSLNSEKKVYIGRPIHNVEIHLLDNEFRPVPRGKIGELFISGVGLAKGYLNEPELTNASFISDTPLAKRVGRLYRTGDLGIENEQGLLEYAGRIDSQIKLRGVRVEPTGIEAAIERYPGIQTCKVVVDDPAKGDPRLTAYFTAETPIDISALRCFLKSKLSAIEIPACLYQIYSFEVTTHGKVDLRRLPACAASIVETVQDEPISLGDDHTRFESIIEKFRSFVKDQIEYNQPILDDLDLFDIGATSFTIVSAAQFLSAEFDISLPVEAFMENCTIGFFKTWLQSAMPGKDLSAVSQAAAGYEHRPAVEPLVKREVWQSALSLVSAFEENGSSFYRYPSAGNSYSVELYLSVGADSLESVNRGFYVFNKDKGSLHYLGCSSSSADFPPDGSFEIHLVSCNTAVSQIYGNFSDCLMTLEAGYICQLLREHMHEKEVVTSLDVKGLPYVFCTFPGFPKHYTYLCTISMGVATMQVPAQSCEPKSPCYRSPSEIDAFNLVPLAEDAKKRLIADSKAALFGQLDSGIPVSNEGAYTKKSYQLRSSKRSFESRRGEIKSRLSQLLKNTTVQSTSHLRVFAYFTPDSTAGGRFELSEYCTETGEFLTISNFESDVLKSVHSPSNRKIHSRAAFSLLFLGRQPKDHYYQNNHDFHLGLLEAGSLAGELMNKQSTFELGLCPIGGVSLTSLGQILEGAGSLQFLHMLVGGAYNYQRAESTFNLDDHRTKRSQDNKDGVAIIGLSCRFPGAGKLDELAAMMESGLSSIGKPDSGRPFPSNWTGGFLEDIDKFDADFFGFGEEEASYTDPQIRLMLEGVWKAIEDAGYTPESLSKKSGSRTGVFVGSMYNHYRDIASANNAQSLSLSSYSGISNRISYHFNCSGPSSAFDTACSSAMMAVHAASESIRRGECSNAIVGAINLSLVHEKFQALEDMGLLSDDTTWSKPYCVDNGYVPGEGMGVLILKSVDEAIEDNDHIYAVIRGSAVNHTGHTRMYSMPSTSAYERLFNDALNNARMDADQIGYIESSANGTPLADAMEFQALEAVFPEGSPQRRINIGTIKAHIGHLEAASGLAQIAKVLLQFRDNKIYRFLHFAHAKDVFKRSERIQLPESTVSWTENGLLPRAALVSGLSAGGSNVAMILTDEFSCCNKDERVSATKEMFLFSAPSAKQLNWMLEAQISFLEQHQGLSLKNLAFTLAVGRLHHPVRVGVLASTQEELVSQLKDIAGKVVHIDAQHLGKPAAETERNPQRFPKKIYELIGTMVEDRAFADVLLLWNTNLQIDWTLALRGMSGNRCSFPGIQFLKNKYWIKQRQVASSIDEICSLSVPQINTLHAEIERRQEDCTLDTIRSALSSILGIDQDSILPETELSQIEVDSYTLSKLHGRLNSRSSFPVKLSRLFRCKRVEDIVALFSHAEPSMT
jgi:amino acid adenylation domain-containing protein